MKKVIKPIALLLVLALFTGFMPSFALAEEAPVLISAPAGLALDNGNRAIAIGESAKIVGAVYGTSFASSDDTVATVDINGVVTARKAGIATITATADGESETLQIVAGPVKARSSIYTEEKLANRDENLKKYDWARAARDKAVADGDKVVDRYEEIWNLVTSQELTRGQWWKNDPNYRLCRYCGEDIMSKDGWIIDALENPWKVQCSACRRNFPSNDFGGYYELGSGATGKFDPALAKAKNDLLVAAGEDGYLKNILYPEKNTAEEPNWGVDDGNGYDTGRYYTGEYSDIKEVHVYIPLYNETGVWWGTWNAKKGGIIPRSLHALREAYIYTGDEKYGIAGAIIIDRVADVYHEMHLKEEWMPYLNSDGGTGVGKVVGRIGDYTIAVNLSQAYDAFWPAMENPKVIEFLSEKAEKYNMENTKTSADLIRYNCDNGILRSIRQGIHDLEIKGNVGYPQMVMAYAGVVLDTFPETAEWIDWIFEPSATGMKGEKGNFYTTMVNTVDRDGWGNEAAPGYNTVWMNAFSTVADILLGYKDTYAAANLYEHPKYRQALEAISKLTLAGKYVPNIGDTGQFAKPMQIANANVLISAWGAGVKDINIARLIYNLKDGDLSGINGGIFSADPYASRNEIQAVIDEHGTVVQNPSLNLTGYGLAMFRDGEVKANGEDTQRSYWMYYGKNFGHGHYDTLNLGVIAYGIDMAPDLGNPDYKTVDCNRITWVNTPMAHNTVTVMSKKGANYQNYIANQMLVGDPYHFDDAGKVKVMDVDAPEFYDETKIFRRTVVSVDATEDVSYAVDFFRVKGGNDHIYNFHAQSEEIEISGAEMVKQENAPGIKESSYAGPSAPYGIDPLWNNDWETPLKYPTGFTWLKNVYRAKNPTSPTISADFKIRDYFDVLPGEQNLHLKLTMLNTDITEFAYADTRPPLANGAPELIKQIMVRRQGKNLDSFYTAVIEPYKDTPYILGVEEVEMKVKSGKEVKNDIARALKVTLKDGRYDYVIYATNNDVTYTVDNKFDFAGFVGVVTYENGKLSPSYTYLNDGTKLGDMEAKASYNGIVTDFTKEMSRENVITVDFNGNVDLEALAGKYIYIDNGGDETSDFNGAYKIESASVNAKDKGKVDLDIGLVTTIRSYKDATDASKGYVYNIAKGMSFEIPLSYTAEPEADFEVVASTSPKAGTLELEVLFNKYDEYDVERFGLYTYKNGKAELAVNSTDGESLKKDGGKFTVTVEKGISAVPFVVISGKAYYGDVRYYK